ncbi:hypothetical protein HNP37_000542 [Flavobacterium nitrogenifigens]|uniref:Uncharacterized protein n=2 Tax=Flavobacterium TaxID=237 RepID=A0A7W7IUE8_9FLAO|nr:MULTISPECIES: hypothetical protein [Flavobacterium]MBB4800503.1 hypothetical protein [Flavobacterium nitrogenifigens]MBB6385747.1 hypothetical protein [Flavobacterium notoginsengisoli]
MITENISKELETRLKDFFSDVVDVKDMAKMLRQVNYSLSLSSMRCRESVKAELPQIGDNFYWLNRLAEVLDPYLDVN